MFFRPWRGRTRALILFGLAAAVLGAVVMRGALLAGAGRILVAEDPMVPVDVIVVGVAADGAGVLEAADLFHGGVAPRVAVFADPPDAIDQEFLRRGVPYEDEAARSSRQLKALGVANIEIISGGFEAGTEAEGEVLPVWSDQQGIKSLVVVTTTDHSRRMRRVLRRTMAAHRARVAVRFARHSVFDPDRWWQSRDGIRIEIAEVQKLLLDVARHPAA